MSGVQTSGTRGLSSADAVRRLAADGLNELPAPPGLAERRGRRHRPAPRRHHRQGLPPRVTRNEHHAGP
ncbi:cation-transporting P-type ATPase [Kribbella sp. NPDC048928]|uniref:cation-transporting P-type ATPase n=1 Tax=Kribbella sp. NPDC048928 TaxID=3364111 RepID=UPI003717F8FC